MQESTSETSLAGELITVDGAAVRRPQKSPSFRFYASDFLGSPTVQLMDAAEVGAYMLLLCMAWESDRHGHLPDNDDKLRRWARFPHEQWLRSRDLILSKFPVVEEGWRANPRMVQEAEKQRLYSEAQSQRGKTGGRGHKKTPKSEGFPEQSEGFPTESEASKNESPVKPAVAVAVAVAVDEDKNKDVQLPLEKSVGPVLVTQDAVRRLASPSKGLSLEDVERIRLAYPRKEKPVMARKAIRAQHALLMRGQVTTAAGIRLGKMCAAAATTYLHSQADAYARSPGLPEPRYILNPADWFSSGNYTLDHAVGAGSPRPRTLAEKLEEQRRAV